MSLFVEVSGFGVCKFPQDMGAESQSVLVVCVQQENFQAWTVYRTYSQFVVLCEQLQSLYPDISAVPAFDERNFNIEKLETCRSSVNRWLQSTTSNSVILRTQFMYQFLCCDANMPPPYMEMHWRTSINGSFDEMEMEEMFEKQLVEEGGGFMADDGGGDVDESWQPDDDEHNASVRQGEMGVWTTSVEAAGGGAMHTSSQMDGAAKPFRPSGMQKSQGGGPARVPGKSRPGMGPGKRTASEANTAHDGLDIQSLSFVEAEYMFDRNEYTDTLAGDSGPAAMATSLGTGKSPGLASFTMTSPDEPLPADSAVKKTINLDTFHIIKVIGKGSFGKVFLVRHKAQGTLHALKVLKKDFIIRKNQVEHTRTERNVLGYVHHPFIVGLAMAFQTRDKLFFVLDYCSGGELFFHLGKTGRFPEDRARFYAAQMTLALEYIHSLGVIYRDLKPENVLLDDKGNVRLTDFGLSKEGVSGHSTGASSFCGTPEYIAPEVLKRQGHGRAVDWWSLGALLYEMVTGLPPFYSRNRETMFDKIMKAELTFPAFMGEEARDLLSKLLVRDPDLRLGSGDRDAQAVKEHAFFRDVDWVGLVQGRVTPPWSPTVAGSLDTSQFDEEFTSMMPTVSPDIKDAYFGSLERAFEGFSYVEDSAAKAMMAHQAQAGGGAGGGGGSSSSSSLGRSFVSGTGATLMATSLNRKR